MYALVDVNSFYCSCETVFRPDLQGRPVVVLSNNDGCIVARNAAAKKIGLKGGEPWFRVRERAERAGCVAFSSNYSHYAEMSHRFMTVLAEMVPRTEIYSIDEAFCDLSGMRYLTDLAEYGREIRRQIQRRTHLTVGVGIAPTHTLAKLANHAAKTWTRTGGVVDLSSPVRQRRLMALVPVADVWGVGRQTSRRLEQSGITTALQLADLPPSLVRKQYSVMLERTVRELSGTVCFGPEEYPAPKEQIVCSRSFGRKPEDRDSLKQAVCAHAERAAEKLRAEHQYCRKVSVSVSTSPFAAGETFYSNMATTPLCAPVQDTRDIIAAAVRALDRVFIPGHRYHKCGVMLSDFHSERVTQYGLFDDLPPRKNSEQLMQLLDSLNHSGKGKIWFAGQGIPDAPADWKMRRDMLSPAWTTRRSDIPVVRCHE